MNAPHAVARLGLFAGIAFGLSCGGDGPSGPIGPDPGPLLIEAARAPAGAGGILVAIEGGPVSAVSALEGRDVWHRSDGVNRTIVLVRGPVAAGGIARFTVPDRRLAYTVTLLEAAAGPAGGYARQPADAFVLGVARVD